MVLAQLEFLWGQEEETEGGMMAGVAEGEAVCDGSMMWAVTVKPHGNFKGVCLE